MAILNHPIFCLFYFQSVGFLVSLFFGQFGILSLWYLFSLSNFGKFHTCEAKRLQSKNQIRSKFRQQSQSPHQAFTILGENLLEPLLSVLFNNQLSNLTVCLSSSMLLGALIMTYSRSLNRVTKFIQHMVKVIFTLAGIELGAFRSCCLNCQTAVAQQ